MTKSEPVEAEVVGDNPTRDYAKSSQKNRSRNAQNSGQKFREKSHRNSRQTAANYPAADFAHVFRVGKIAAALILILLVCLFGLILKFLVGVFAGILQFVVVAAALALVGWLIYSFAKGRQ